MADSILRLKVDSQEYDQKIKRAAEGIQQYAQKCRDAGGTLQYLDDGVLEFVQALGKMDTVATGTKQQLREMSNALTTLTQTYRGLTDEEKASPFGQELAKGIQQLTERAGQAQDAMADVQASIRNAASDTRLFDQMAQGMSVATAGFQGLTGAGKLLGIEMGNDVEVIAKLQAAMAVTNSLTTIQTALQKQSALMQGLNAAKTALATAAQTAYAVATGEATVAQTAFNIAASANPYGLLLAGVGALVGAIAAFASTTGESTEEVKDATSEMDSLTESVNNAAEAYERLSNKIKSLGIGGQKEYHALRQSKVDQYNQLNERYANIGNNMRFYENRGETDSPIYQQLKEEHQKIKEEAAKIMKDIKTLDAANKDRIDRMNKYKLLDFSDVTSQAEAESAVSFLKEQMRYVDNTTESYRQLARAKDYAENIILASYTPKSNTTTHKSTGSSKEDVKIIPKSVGFYENEIADLKKIQKNVTTNEAWAELQHQIGKSTIKVKELKGELKDVPASIKDITGDINKATDAKNKKIQDRLNDPSVVSKGMAAVVKQIERDQKKDDKKEKKYLSEGLGKLGGGLGGIQSGFQQLGVDLGAGFNDVVNGLQGITTILTAIQTIVSAIQIIAGADALIPFASGGIVRAAGGTLVGNSFSGDNLRGIGPGGQIYGLNAGEVVLNRAQAGVLADALSSPAYNNLRLETYVSGRDLKVVLNNDSESRGKGRYLTSVNYKG